jgi:putative SOS response-associated peptidase YedK
MCGRSSITKTEKQIEERFGSTFYSDDLERYNPLPNYNVAPTHMHPLITNVEKDKINIFRWGLIPNWSKDEKIGYNMINARIETLLEKTSFKNLISNKRCIVPMDGFYEWKTEGKEKQPYRIFTKDQEIFCCAGLYDSWRHPDGRTVNSYTIITLEANEFMSEIHHRMPAILTNISERMWLNGKDTPEETLAILNQYDSDKMDKYPVNPKVGNVREQSKDLIRPYTIIKQGSLFD